ncbi:MAG: sulfotransferase [Planctomycetota bacterium]
MDLTFLICSERSGSNLITRMLDAHPEVCGPPPTHAVRTFALNILRYGDLTREENWIDLTEDLADLLKNQLGAWRTSTRGEEIRREATERSLAAALRVPYEREAAAHGKQALFIKENQTERLLPYILTAFPTSKFVYLVRDPRDMALSWKLSSNHPGRVARGAETWKRNQERGIACYGFLKPTGRIHLLRYEDLIEDPEREMIRICRFLDLPYSAEMLSFHVQGSTRANASRLRDWENLARPVMSGNSNKYRAALSRPEIEFVEALFREEMVFLSYPLEFEPGDLERAREALEKLDAGAGESAAKVDGGEIEIRERRLQVLRRILSRPAQP